MKCEKFEKSTERMKKEYLNLRIQEEEKREKLEETTVELSELREKLEKVRPLSSHHLHDTPNDESHRLMNETDTG